MHVFRKLKTALLRLGQIRGPGKNKQSTFDPYPCVTHRVELARFRSLRRDIVVLSSNLCGALNLLLQRCLLSDLDLATWSSRDFDVCDIFVLQSFLFDV
jgi:hypothetical protein